MSISRWGSRVEEKLTGPFPTVGPLGQELSPSELVTAIAQNTEIQQTEVLIAEGIALRVTKFFRGATAQVFYKMAQDWYAVDIHVVDQGKPQKVSWQMRAEDIAEKSVSTKLWNAYLDDTGRRLIEMLDRIGVKPNRKPPVMDGIQGNYNSFAQAARAASGTMAGFGSSVQQVGLAMPRMTGKGIKGMHPQLLITDEAQGVDRGPTKAEQRAAIESIKRSAQKAAE